MIRAIIVLCGLVLMCNNVYAVSTILPPSFINVVPDICGCIKDDNGVPIPDIMIDIYKRNYDGADVLVTTICTDKNGRYTIAGDFKGTYVVTPNDKRYSFNPLNGAVEIKGTTTTKIK